MNNMFSPPAPSHFSPLTSYLLPMTRLQVTTPEALPEEISADAALRPSRLDEFVGQSQVKASLQIAIDAAKARRDTLDHTLFFGPPGLGKTTLAMLMAREMGVQLRTTSGPVLEKPGRSGRPADLAQGGRHACSLMRSTG